MPEPLPELRPLLDSWELSMKAVNKSPTTITSYMRGVRMFIEWCERSEHRAELTRPLVQTYIAELIEDGKEANTVRLRLAALRAFARWLVEEDELSEDPLTGIKQPKIPSKVVESLSDEQLRNLIAACRGKGLRDRRDEAIVRLMAETGIRSNELVSLGVSDLDLPRGLVTIQRGKGAKGRIAPFGPQTAAALDRYLRMRRSHKLADADALWVGVGGKSFAYFGLNDTLRRRAASAGIEGFHLHLLRHTYATRWLRAGGSEQGLMAVAGWSTRSMIDRYTGASASERAAAESRGLGLGEI
ncbi:tyrosine-type recombinase/integrase [Mycobacterium sp. 236(2023)]|uniref:tyrosine-type recombinase/integrase n=1 Tax=Mycobacterium sp. 236(2023) TaxID=3038163 RepID=UPI0024159392|nr:tyrosine-type recombinase/integrase [Mycobacterium sp. 236(2023)]MDG4669462.1 tyrosine-type recombinase/integrase [Mycobacterium sp. 236(2023)]